MKRIIELLKQNRDKFLDYQLKSNRNMLLCLFGLEPDKKLLKQIRTGGWQNMVAYFPYEKMAYCEINVIQKKSFPTYSIAGVTLVDKKMLYFATTRIHVGKKMIARQKNFDHLYQNQKIYVFETEEEFVNFLSASDDFCGLGITPNETYNDMKDFIANSLEQYPVKSDNKMEASIVKGILEINPVNSLADQMTV